MYWRRVRFLRSRRPRSRSLPDGWKRVPSRDRRNLPAAIRSRSAFAEQKINSLRDGVLIANFANTAIRPESGTIKTARNNGQLSNRSVSRSDYWESALSPWCWNTDPATDYLAKPRTLAEIRDGASNTMLYFEDAGRPYYCKRGTAQSTTQKTDGEKWADYAAYYHSHEAPFQNVNNSNETFSFHMGGCNTSFADGSVRFITDGTDLDVYASLFTCNAADIASEQ